MFICNCFVFFQVRVVAVEGVCRVLGVYWDLVPAGVTKKLTIRIIKDLCYDASSSPVFRGLTYVLSTTILVMHSCVRCCNQVYGRVLCIYCASQSCWVDDHFCGHVHFVWCLEYVLPTIGFSLHDKAERVRTWITHVCKKCYNNDDDILFSLQVRCNFLDLLLRVKTLKDIHFIEVRHPPLFIQHT